MRRCFHLCALILVASTAAASANPGDRVIRTRSFVLRDRTSTVHCRAMLKSDTYPMGRRQLQLLLWRRGEAPPYDYYVVGSSGIDRNRTDFVVRSFVVKPKGPTAIIRVRWRRRGSARLRSIRYRATFDGLKPIRSR